MKISELPTASPTLPSDNIIVDRGSSTLKSTLSAAIEAALDDMPESKNIFVRDKNLGSTFTSSHATAIRSQNFKDLFLGDYWSIDSVNYRIVGFNLFRNRGSDTTRLSRPHIVVMPDKPLATGGWNTSATVNTGYKNAAVRSRGLAEAKKVAQTAFGSYILSYTDVMSAGVSGDSFTSEYDNDCMLELPSEVHVLGTSTCSASPTAASRVSRTSTYMSQFPLFTQAPKYQLGVDYWTRDIAGETESGCVVLISSTGGGSWTYANRALGIRPFFLVG